MLCLGSVEVGLVKGYASRRRWARLGQHPRDGLGPEQTISVCGGGGASSSRSDVSPSRNQHNGVSERRGGDSPGATSWGKQRGLWEAWMAHTNHTAGTPIGLGAGPFLLPVGLGLLAGFDGVGLDHTLRNLV